MAAGEDEREPLVGDRAHVVVLARELLQPCEELHLLAKDAIAPDAVDRAVLRGRDDPGRGVARVALSRPALERRRERVLDGVLGELEVAERAGEDPDSVSPLLPEDLLDACLQTSSLGHDRPDLDRPVIRGRDLARDRIASSRSGSSTTKSPPMISFVSGKGPSVTSRSPSRTRTTLAVFRLSSS